MTKEKMVKAQKLAEDITNIERIVRDIQRFEVETTNIFLIKASGGGVVNDVDIPKHLRELFKNELEVAYCNELRKLQAEFDAL